MPELPMINIYAVMIFWLVFMLSSVITTGIQYYKKKFLDNIIYIKHRRLWINLAILWYLGGSIYLAIIFYDVYGGVGHPMFFFGFLLKALFYFLIPILILLAISLLPAMWPNRFGNKYAIK